MKTVLKILLWIVIGILIAMLLLPFVFKDKVKEEVRTVINQQINAEVDFGDVGLSFFKAFPNASVSVSDVSLKGKEPFENIELLHLQNILLNVNIMSLFGDKTIEINEIILDRPDLNVIVNSSGIANYDIMKSSESQSESGEISAHLNAYKIKNGKLRFKDLSTSMDLSMKNINHSGKGQFSNTVFDLSTQSDIEDISMVYTNIPYLKNAHLEGDINLKVDLNEYKFTLSNNDIKLNNLDLKADGFVMLLNSGYQMDLDFEAPNTEFMDLFSLVPNAYTKDYNNIDAGGSAFFKGKVKGIYSDHSLPGINLVMNAKNGHIKYPDLPQSLTNINLDAKVNAASSDWSDLSVQIPVFSLNIGQEKFEGKLNIDNALGNFNTDGFLKGKLDLAALQKAFPVEDLNSMNGIADINLEFLTDKQSINNGNYNNMKLNGITKLNNINVSYADYPFLKIPSATINASPQNSNIKADNVQFGKSDFDITGTIKNPLSLTTDEKTNVDLSVSSDILDSNELMTMGGESAAETETTNMDSLSESIIKNIDINYDMSIKDMKYEAYDIKNVKATGLASANEISVDKGSLDFESSKINIDGQFNNGYDYVFNEEKLEGTMDIQSASIDLNKMYSDSQSSTEEDLETVLIPKNISMDINANIGEIQYGKYDFKNIKGLVEVDEGRANFKDVDMQALGGDMKLDGFYDSSMETKPTFSLAYNLANVSFNDLYAKSISFQILAPIAKFINGNLNSTLNISGPLGQDMMPILGEITADGFLETLDSKINGFGPLSQLGEKLGIKDFTNLAIENTKNWFEVKDGAVLLKPSSREFDGMKFNYSGKHYVDQKIDYLIKAEIPRDKMKSNVVSGAAEAGMSMLEREASKRGIDINLGDIVFLDIEMTGTITKPKFKIIPTGSGGKSAKDIVKDEITNQMEEIKDTLTKEAQKKIDEVKVKATKKANDAVDTVTNKVKVRVAKKIDDVKAEAADQVSDKVKDVIKNSPVGTQVDTLTKQVEDKVGDVLGDKAKEEAEKVKDKLKDFNPFKKKKKD